MVQRAKRDGKNFALLLKNLKGGKNTFEITFIALAEHYAPFLNADFRKAFYQGVQNDK